MGIIHGGSIVVSRKVGSTYTAFAAAKSCDIEVSDNDFEVSSATQGSWKSYKAGRKSWKVTVSGLVMELSSTLLQVGSEYQLKINVTGASPADQVTGYALCKSAKVTGTQGNLGQYNCTFNGNGELA